MVDAAEEGRLAGAGGPDHADDFARLHLERNPFEDLETAEALVHAFGLDHRLGTRYLIHVLVPVTDPHVSAQSLKRRRRKLPRRATTKVALEVVLPERKHGRDDQVPDARHNQQWNS